MVVLYRGDNITGEVKELAKGKLKYKTDDLGTTFIEWDKIAHLTSKHYFEVEDEQGRRFYGRLGASAEAGQLLVILSDTVSLAMLRVVAITPIEASFWSRLDGYVDVGFDFQRANRNRSLSGAGEVRYRGQKWATKLTGSTYFQRQEDTDGTSRNNLSWEGQRLFGRHWSAVLFGSLDQNQELNLDLRQTIGVGVVRDVIRTNRMTFQAVGGVAYADEQYTGEAESSGLLQVPIATSFAYFKFDSPKADVSSNLTITPVLTDLGRWRIDFDIRLSYELIGDFTIGLRFFDNFDSRPPSEEAGTNDFGLTLSLGYSF